MSERIEVRNGRAVGARDGMYERVDDDFAEAFRRLERQRRHLEDVRPKLDALVAARSTERDRETP